MIDTVFVPRGAEAAAVGRALARVKSPVRIVTTGIGPHAADLAATAALAGPTIGRALVTGFCGLLSAAFAVGDPLVYGTLVSPDGAVVTLERALASEIAARIAGAQSGIRAVSSPAVVTRARDKYALGERYAAQAVDMESLPLVRRLMEANVAVAVVRIGSDAASDDLPELHMALDGAGGLDGFALALAMLREPLAGVRLARNGARALATLDATIGMILTQDEPTAAR